MAPCSSVSCLEVNRQLAGLSKRVRTLSITASVCVCVCVGGAMYAGRQKLHHPIRTLLSSGSVRKISHIMTQKGRPHSSLERLNWNLKCLNVHSRHLKIKNKKQIHIKNSVYIYVVTSISWTRLLLSEGGGCPGATAWQEWQDVSERAWGCAGQTPVLFPGQREWAIWYLTWIQIMQQQRCIQRRSDFDSPSVQADSLRFK